jgi:Helix-turn-helix domain
MSELLTEHQAAAQLHVCTRTVRRLRKAGALRFVAVTERTILYRPEDIAAFIEQRTQVCHDPAPSPRRRTKRAQRPGNVVSFTERRRQRKGQE